MAKSIFLSHNHNDKPFVRRLAADLQLAGAKVWIDDAEIKVGDSLLTKIEDGLLQSDYLGVVLSPNSVKSNWVNAELRAILTQEIGDQKVRILPIIYEDCDIPLFLRDKLSADFKREAYRKALTNLLRAMGLSYEPIRRARIETPWDPLSEAVERIYRVQSHEQRQVLATALYVSVHAPWIANQREVAIPQFIENEYRVPLHKQPVYRIAFSKKDAFLYLRDRGRKVKSFQGRAEFLVPRYRQIFGREPAHGRSGPEHLLFSYAELFEWFTIPEDTELPDPLQGLVLTDRLPQFSDT